GELAEAFKGMVAELKEKQQLVDFLSATGAHTVALRPSIAVNAVGPIPGEVFAGRYEIKSVLGQGGMGVVYRAVDRELDEQVAIKLLHGEMVRRDASLLERFKQEIRLARRITHPNVVRTHDMGEAAGLYFITMEFVEGTSLDDLIRKRGKLPVGVTLTVARQLLRALEAAHAQGVVHRDIKPQNMIVDAQGFLKVMDFGIARLADNSKGLTMDGAVVGTPDYMAPEQLLGREVDGRADIYATGAVLFQCLTGERLFPADSLPTLIMKQVEEPARDPRTLSPEVPPALAQAILKALAKDPAARFQTAHDFAVALERM
ncbi:MAG: serine/threonine protein kinase, partial [Gemmatimonadetes bacterium]|nr:serine/threonine protein kinase [Gemmatimonadota bacterium]